MSFQKSFSRRNFIKSAVAIPALAAIGSAQSQLKRPDFPYVDGLCLEILSKPENIRASGLSAMLADVSVGEVVKEADGSSKYRRNLTLTARSIVETRQKLRKTPDAFLATDGREIKEAHKKKKTAVFLQIQGGGEIVGEDLTRLDLLHELGLKVFQMTHHHNNPLGGGGIEVKTSGLTKLGFEAVEKLNALNMIPDLSHASDQTAMDVLKTSKKTVILSHGAVRAIVNHARCAPDEVIRGIANSGGVMGIFMMSFWLTYDDPPTVESWIKNIRHVVNVGGIDAVGVANDFPLDGEHGVIESKNNNAEAVKNYLPWWNGFTKLGILGFEKEPKHVAVIELNNINRMFTIHQALGKSGFKSREIEKIMGGNWIRVLSS